LCTNAKPAVTGDSLPTYAADCKKYHIS
jgi:hypothetical protein